MLLNYTQTEADLSEGPGVEKLATSLRNCRNLSMRLTEPLSPEDQVVQACEDASPTKWHLAHTTWFFEELVLKRFAPGYREFDKTFSYCFNSYYESVGPRQPRPKRGLLTRPSLESVHQYRDYVDTALERFLSSCDSEVSESASSVIRTGISHEQQHQELLLMDILNVFADQPLRPAYLEVEKRRETHAPLELDWVSFDGGLHEIGHQSGEFAYDNEGPYHQQFLQPFKLANRPVTNGEWLAFVEDGGYETVSLWLSDGWAKVQADEWRAPLYWEILDGGWRQMSLRGGLTELDLSAPVCHVSYYEAEAFARWSGYRLPTEFEWEVASRRHQPDDGNFLGSGEFAPVAARCSKNSATMLHQLFGDVWEWTQSPYAPYPGYRPPEGTIGEYNGKFMCNQFVLRGGACVTPDGHVRHTYRNFFYPHHRWQFGGLRLAQDV